MRIMRFHAPTAKDVGRRAAAIVSAVWLVLGAPACSEAPSSRGDLLTRAERTDFRETSSYADVVAFMERAAAADSRLHLTSFGYSFEGRTLPLIVVGDLPDPDPETVRASGKTVVYLQGNIHAGEVCGKEALQILLRDLVEGRHREWFESLVLLIAPIYNADGNERVALTNRGRQNGPIGGMGQRPNAQGYDLNRDHMKLDSPEARSLARLFTEYDPHVALDLHTTNGTRHAYHITYAPPLHPNTPVAIDRLLREQLLPDLTDAVREKHGWEYYYYGNAFAPPGAEERGWYTFDHRPRFNSNYIGLRNRFALLSEAYSYATFEERVLATLYFVEETLDYVHEHGEEIRAITAAEDSRSLVGDSLALRVTRARSDEPVHILMGEVEEKRHPLTGRPLLERRDGRRTETMNEYGTFAPSEWEMVPAGYLIPPELDEVIVRLQAHGVRMESRPASSPTIVGEVFQIDSVTTAERVFQGHNEQTLFGHYEPHEVPFSEGTRWVPADQPLGRLIFSLLEPRSDDGFAAWGFLAEYIEDGGTYPIARAHALVR
jgi:hypothetical protein